MKKQAEVVVIGAGIMGASLAYFLAKHGKELLCLLGRQQRELQRHFQLPRGMAVADGQNPTALRKACVGWLQSLYDACGRVGRRF